MPEDLLFIGAGGQTPDIVETALLLNRQERRFNLLGVLDDDPALAGREIAGLNVLGPVAMAKDWPAVGLVNCVLSPAGIGRRPDMVEACGGAARRWPRLVNPSAAVSPSAMLDPGTVVLANATICAGARLGFGTTLLPGAVVSHDCRLGEHTVLASGAVLSGGVATGSSCYLGAGSLVRDGLRIGRGALVGMGAVVVREVAAGQVVAGNPARPLRRD